MDEFSVTGKRIPRLDALSKVVGEAKFAADIYLPGMLHGKVLRSNRPHAWILRTAMDMPDLTKVIVKSYDDNGTFGAKQAGNRSVINLPPANANAVFTLTGFRIKELPITTDKILEKGAVKKGGDRLSTLSII
jgi:CO/xanthine dehydrogenase Mo-binding subunit